MVKKYKRERKKEEKKKQGRILTRKEKIMATLNNGTREESERVASAKVIPARGARAQRERQKDRGLNARRARKAFRPAARQVVGFDRSFISAAAAVDASSKGPSSSRKLQSNKLSVILYDRGLF